MGNEQWKRIEHMLPGKVGEPRRGQSPFCRSGAVDFTHCAPLRHLPEHYDRTIYKDRNRIERFFCRFKQFRRIATRYDKLVERYASIVALGASFVWLNA